MYIEIHVLVHKVLRELGGGRILRSSEAVWKAGPKGNVQLRLEGQGRVPHVQKGELF